MAYKFQYGKAQMSGALEQVGNIRLTDDQGQFRMLVDRDVGNMQIAGSGTFGTTVSGAGNFTIPNGNIVLSEVAMTADAGELNLLDTATAGTVVVSKAVIYSAAGIVQGTDFKGPDGFGISNATVTDFMKLDAAKITIKDGTLDFDIASHDTSNGLKLGGTLVSATAAELNYNDIATIGTAAASKAVTVSAGSKITLGAIEIEGSAFDVNGGNIDGTAIGADSHTTGKFTTCDATTNFTIDGLVLTADTITNDQALTVVSTGFTVNASLDIALSADGGNVTMDDGTTTVFDFNTDEPAMKIMDDANVADYYSVAVGANGATTISTVDADAALANLTITADGTVDINSTGDLTLDSSTDIVLDAAGGQVKPASNDQCGLGVAGTAFSDLFLAEGGVINWDSGDATLTQVSDVVTLAGATFTATLTNGLSAVATGGISMTAFNGSAAISDLELSLDSLEGAAVDVALDSIAIIDANDSNVTAKESIADLVSAMAGSGLTATSGVLAVDGTGGGTPTGVGNVLVTLAEGFTYGTTTLTASHAWTLPAAPTAGDILRVKMPATMTPYKITITGTADQQIDGGNPLLPVEQGGAVVNLICLKVSSSVPAGAGALQWGLF